MEEIKKSAHYLFINDSEYNKDKNFYDFLLDLVLYDSSQINFNYISSLFSNTIINLINEIPTYILCTFCNFVSFILIFFFHLLKLTDPHGNELIYLCKIMSFFLPFYLFTGIIGLFPFHLLENKNNPKNIILGNLCLFFGVIIKNGLHLLLIHIFNNNHVIYWIKGLLFLISSFLYIIFLYKKIPKKYIIIFINILKVN